MRILILGATGRTGKEVVHQALAEGYEVNVVVRQRMEVPGLNQFIGQANDPFLLINALKEVEAVIQVLNISRNNDFPWAKLRSPKDLLSSTMQELVRLADREKLKHIVCCSAWGVAETRKDIPFWFRLLIEYSNIGVAYADHEKQEKILEKSGIAYTIVRPVGLTNGKLKKSISISTHPKLTISRKSLAYFLVESLGMEERFNRRQTISR